MFGFVKKAVRSVIKTGLRVVSTGIRYLNRFHRLQRLALLFGLPAGMLLAGAILADACFGRIRGGYDSAGEMIDGLTTDQAAKSLDILMNSGIDQQPAYPNLPGLIVC